MHHSTETRIKKFQAGKCRVSLKGSPFVDIFSGCANILETVCTGVNINKKMYISFGMVRCAGSGPSDLVRHRHNACISL